MRFERVLFHLSLTAEVEGEGEAVGEHGSDAASQSVAGYGIRVRSEGSGRLGSRASHEDTSARAAKIEGIDT